MLPITQGTPPPNYEARISIHTHRPLLTFNPHKVLGCGIDECDTASILNLFSRHNVREFTKTGLRSFTYRLYTELNVQAWHWNPIGTWSDPIRQQGYFTGSAKPGAFITSSGCFALPRRGDTFDQGDNKSYSRLDDGNNDTFWKSDPYLGSRYTGQPDSAHPQWIIADLGAPQPINAISIRWLEPYAQSFKVQYWTGSTPFDHPNHGSWVTFSHGSFTNMQGGDQLLRVAANVHQVRFIRLRMTISSHTSISPSTDPRDRQGYAIAEVGLGELNSADHFQDAVHHLPSTKQTAFYVSSTDPWHTKSDFLPGWDQPGLDLCFRSGLTKGEASLVPVAMVYSTPQDAVAELSYLKARGYRLAGVELGEEPDGQEIDPEDYAALYIQWATAIRKRFPRLLIGGPVLSSIDAQAPDAFDGVTDWLPRFIGYLHRNHALKLLDFVSTEHYPFNGGIVTPQTVAQEPAQMSRLFHIVKAAGVPSHVPVFITETNMSAGTANTSGHIGARWVADAIGSFLSYSNAGHFYFYEFDPFGLGPAAQLVWGSYCPFTVSKNNQINQPTGQFWALRMITHDWLSEAGGAHTTLATTVETTGTSSSNQVSAYAVGKPGGSVGLLLINHSATSATPLAVKTPRGFHHCNLYVLDSSTFQWVDNGAKSYARLDIPPKRVTLPTHATTEYTMPAGSVAVMQFTR